MGARRPQAFLVEYQLGGHIVRRDEALGQQNMQLGVSRDVGAKKIACLAVEVRASTSKPGTRAVRQVGPSKGPLRMKGGR